MGMHHPLFGYFPNGRIQVSRRIHRFWSGAFQLILHLVYRLPRFSSVCCLRRRFHSSFELGTVPGGQLAGAKAKRRCVSPTHLKLYSILLSSRDLEMLSSLFVELMFDFICVAKAAIGSRGLGNESCSRFLLSVACGVRSDGLKESSM